MKKIVFNATDAQFALVQKLMDLKSFFNVSETMRFLIVEGTDRHLNNYKELARQKMSAKLTPTDKALAQIQAQDERVRIRKEQWIEGQNVICETLGGSVIDKDGVPVCVFNKFQELPGGAGLDSTVTTIPLEFLTDEQIHLQYSDMAGRTGLDIKDKLLNK